MEINNLLESSNQFKSMQQDANKLADKWKQSGLLEGLGEKESNNMAMILENQAKQIVSEANSTNVGGGSFTAGAGEQWAGVALPLVRKVFAQIVAQDFVSVQPMNLPSGLVFYLDFKYGTGANGFNDGENLYGNVSSASTKMSVDEDVADGLYGAGKFGYSINPATFTGLGAGDLAGTLATGKFTTASVDLNTDLADFDYDLDFSQSAAAAGNGAKIVKINILSTDLTLPDTEGVRAFSCDSADITTVHRQYTKISGTTISFIVTETADIDANTALSIGYLTQPVDNDRGDF